jgi:hypothetical protein
MVFASQVNLSIVIPKKYLQALNDFSDLDQRLWGTALTCSALKAYEGEMLRGALEQFNKTIVNDYLQFTNYMDTILELLSGQILPPPMQISKAKLLLGAAQAYLRAIQADVAALENVTQTFHFKYCNATNVTPELLLKIANVSSLTPEEAVQLVNKLGKEVNPADCYFQMKLYEILAGLKKWINTEKSMLKELESKISTFNRVVDNVIADMYGEKAATVLQSLSDDLKVYTIAKILNSSIPVVSVPSGTVNERAYIVGKNMYSTARYGFIINVASPYAQSITVPKYCNGVFEVMNNFLKTMNMNLVNSKFGGINKLASCFSAVMKSELNMSLKHHNMNFVALKKEVQQQQMDLENVVNSYEILLCSR